MRVMWGIPLTPSLSVCVCVRRCKQVFLIPSFIHVCPCDAFCERPRRRGMHLTAHTHLKKKLPEPPATGLKYQGEQEKVLSYSRPDLMRKMVLLVMIAFFWPQQHEEKKPCGLSPGMGNSQGQTGREVIKSWLQPGEDLSLKKEETLLAKKSRRGWKWRWMY